MRVAVLFHRFGPYHVARLNAAARLLPALVGVEASAETKEYAWDPVRKGIEFERVTLSASTDFRSLSFRERWQRVHDAFQHIQPHVVAIPGWSSSEALTVLSWCQRRRVAVIVMSESTALDFSRTRWREWVKSLVVGQASSGLVGGTAHQQYMVRLGMPADRIFKGYDVVDNEHFAKGASRARGDERACRRELGLRRPYVLASSRFIPKKNLLGLLQGYVEYRRMAGREPWDLVVLGDGPLRQKIERVRRQLELTEFVRLAGFKQYDELPSYYGLAGAFVHASTREQWGLVVNEAMASGLPVIVSERVGCAADLVRHGENGLLFDPYDVGALATLMADIAHGGVDRAAMGEKSRLIINDWAPDRFAEGLRNAARSAREHKWERKWLDSIVVRALAVAR